MNNKRVKGCQNEDKLYAEYKQAMQKSSIRIGSSSKQK